jgi:hypothetical protein
MKAVSQILSAPGVLAASLAIAAPRELYGKSIIVNSTEKRIQRDSDEIQFHSAVRRVNVLCIRERRVFNRSTISTGRMDGWKNN